MREDDYLMSAIKALGEKIGMLEYMLEIERDENARLKEKIKELEENANGNGNRCDG